MAKKSRDTETLPAVPGLLLEEVALRLGVSTPTVHRLRCEGKLHTKRVYNRAWFDPAEVSALAAERSKR